MWDSILHVPTPTVPSVSSCPSVPVLDESGLEPGEPSVHDQPFQVVKPRRSRRKKKSFQPAPLSQPTAGSHTLLFRPRGKGESLQRADFSTLLTILQALGALLPARWIRGGGLAVDFATAAKMESAASITALAGVPVRATKPAQSACRSGVVSGVSPGLSPSAFVSEAAAGNPDLKIHRAQRLGNPASSWTIKIVFEGTVLPSHLLFRFRSHPVRAFERAAPRSKPTPAPPVRRQLSSSAAVTTPVAVKIPAPARQEPRAPESPPAATRQPERTQQAVQTDPIVPPALPPVTESAVQTDAVELPAPAQELQAPQTHSRATSPIPLTPKQCYECYSHLQPTPCLEILLGEAYLRGKRSQGWKEDQAFLLKDITRWSAHQLTSTNCGSWGSA